MSSCRSCGSCPEYLRTQSGKCDYCDCSHADHTPAGGQSMSPVKPAPLPAFNTTQNYFPQQQLLQVTAPPPPQMQYGRQFMQMQPAFGMHQQGQVPMMGQFNPMMTTPFDPPPTKMYTQPQPYFGGMSNMPMSPPDQMFGPSVVNKSCSSCGAIFSNAGSPNKLNLCSTCLQDKPASICSKCNTNAANPGFTWCQNCFETDTKCRKCGRNNPNEGYKWCESCYKNEQSENPIDCVPPDCMVPPGAEAPGGSCPSCGNQKFFDMKKNKCFDFCGQTCANQHYANHGVLKLGKDHGDYINVSSKFKSKWNAKKGVCPEISSIFKINPKGSDEKFNAYIKSLRHENVNLVEYHFHGCKVTCNLLASESLCTSADCTICQVSRQGFDISKVGTNVKFTRFGKGLYFAPESSKCHDYTRGDKRYGCRAMFYVRCAPGFKQVSKLDEPNRTAPDEGYDSLYGLAGGNLNYDELCLYKDAACVPEYIIFYVKDGVDKRCLDYSSSK